MRRIRRDALGQAAQREETCPGQAERRAVLYVEKEGPRSIVREFRSMTGRISQGLAGRVLRRGPSRNAPVIVCFSANTPSRPMSSRRRVTRQKKSASPPDEPQRSALERGLGQEPTGWGMAFPLLDNSGSWHRRGMELLHKLQKQGRLLTAPPALPTTPEQESDWSREALESHRQHPLTGIVLSDRLAEEFSREPVVSGVGGWPAAPGGRTASGCAGQAYNKRLPAPSGPCPASCNHLMFIDPHLDPASAATRFRETPAGLPTGGIVAR